MTPEQVLAVARQTWPLPWEIDPAATDPAVVGAEIGALTVAIAITTSLVVVGTLGEELFFEEETVELTTTLAALEAEFRHLVAVPPLA